MGWWDDSQEPFEGQWNRISSGLSPLAEERLWPVSYTHLDVYKRQIWFSTISWISSTDTALLSFTHLYST